MNNNQDFNYNDFGNNNQQFGNNDQQFGNYNQQFGNYDQNQNNFNNNNMNNHNMMMMNNNNNNNHNMMMNNNFNHNMMMNNQDDDLMDDEAGISDINSANRNSNQIYPQQQQTNQADQVADKEKFLNGGIKNSSVSFSQALKQGEIIYNNCGYKFNAINIEFKEGLLYKKNEFFNNYITSQLQQNGGQGVQNSVIFECMKCLHKDVKQPFLRLACMLFVLNIINWLLYNEKDAILKSEPAYHIVQSGIVTDYTFVNENGDTVNYENFKIYADICLYSHMISNTLLSIVFILFGIGAYKTTMKFDKSNRNTIYFTFILNLTSLITGILNLPAFDPLYKDKFTAYLSVHFALNFIFMCLQYSGSFNGMTIRKQYSKLLALCGQVPFNENQMIYVK